jgi:ABC-2 type transport system permease protein
MTTPATLSWFARHEMTLAWRDWTQMMAGGKSARERAVTIGLLIFVVLLHWLAYAIVKPLVTDGVELSTHTLVYVTATVLLVFSMMLSQAIEQVTRAFYARADLDLILSSPAPSGHLFAVRIGSVAVTGFLMTSLLAAPFINMAVALDGAKWFSAYGVLAAMSMLATGLAILGALALFRAVGATRTRFIAQIIAAVVGAALLIGLQVVAVLTYGNLSRIEVLRSEMVLSHAPVIDSLVWLPAKAVLGDGTVMAFLLAAAAAALTLIISATSGRFSSQAIATNSVSGDVIENAGRNRTFKRRSTVKVLRAKEWMLLKRDPWLASQTLMQILYLLPPALLLWRDMGADAKLHVILAPVLVMAFGQLSGGLSWLAISGEDAPDLVATAPVPQRALIRAKIESVLIVIGAAAAPFLLALAFVSPWGAAVTALGIVLASAAGISIQMWYRVSANRSQFRRRQTASKAATFAEAFSSIFWAGATGFAAAQSWFALAFAFLALLTLAIARFIAPPAAR